MFYIICVDCEKTSSRGLNVTLNADGNGYTTTGIGACGETDIIIPSKIYGKPVTTIGTSACYNCSSLTIYCEAESEPSGWNSYWNSSAGPVYWYRENEPTEEGNYWHYVDGVPTAW